MKEMEQPMDAIAVSDSQALQLRQEGKTFIAIAKLLGYEMARDALFAFNRALRRHSPAEQADLRRDEMARLQSITDSIQARTDLTPEEQASRLQSVERMRARLLMV